jgi:hypothetical protein
MALDPEYLGFEDYIPTERRGVSVLTIYLPVFCVQYAIPARF